MDIFLAGKRIEQKALPKFSFLIKLVDEVLRKRKVLSYVRKIDDIKERNTNKRPITSQVLVYPGCSDGTQSRTRKEMALNGHKIQVIHVFK